MGIYLVRINYFQLGINKNLKGDDLHLPALLHVLCPAVELAGGELDHHDLQRNTNLWGRDTYTIKPFQSILHCSDHTLNMFSVDITGVDRITLYSQHWVSNLYKVVVRRAFSSFGGSRREDILRLYS